MSTTTVHQPRHRSKRRKASTRSEEPGVKQALAIWLAAQGERRRRGHEPSPPLAAGDPEAAFAQIGAYLESADAEDMSLAQREALWHLAALPFEACSVPEACKVIARVLTALERVDEEQLVHRAFERSVRTRPTVRP